MSLCEQLDERRVSSDWLAHSEGFQVDAPGGRVGLVEAVMLRHGPDDPFALVVRAGMLGQRLLVVPAEEIERVEPRRRRVVLRASPEVGDADFVSELLRRLGEAAGDVVRAGAVRS